MAQSQKFLVDLDLQGNKLKNVVLGTTTGTANGAIWFDAATGLVKFIDAAGATQSVAAQSFVASAVADEAADRASEITRVEGLVSAEEAARILAVNAVAADLADEVTNRGVAVSAVAADLADEVTARQNAVSNVASDLADEVTARQTAVSNVASDLADEVTARQNAVSNVASDLSDEVTARQNADSALDLRVTAVEADLAALDTNFATDASVVAAVETETNRALAAEAAINDSVTAVQENLDDEVLARQNAVTAVQENLDDEVLARQNAVTGVQENLDDEVVAREAAVAAVANDLADEVANRGTAITGVQNNINDEAARALAAEGQIASDLADELVNRELQFNSVADAVDAEIARALAAELAISDRVTDLEDATSTYALASVVSSDFASEAARADAYADAAAATAEANAIAHADLIAQGLNVKEAVRTIIMNSSGGVSAVTQATTGTYTAYSKLVPAEIGFEIDPNDEGVELAIGDHVIYMDIENSFSAVIYTVAAGAWTVREDWANDTTKAGSFVYVAEGAYTGTSWAAFDASESIVAFTQLTGIPSLYVADPTINLEADGLGISVNTDFLIEMLGFARKATGLITIGSGTTHTISHSLGQDVVVSIRKSSTNEIVQAHVVCNANSITITLNANPADSALLVTIIG
jgi:hypothetical protein